MKKFFLFSCIVVLAIVLRFWHLGVNPPSLAWDEAAWGYNAYSIGIDGRDEFGRFLPLDYLESFGDFKPPFYAYADVIPVKIWGLTPFATRFPSAFFGCLTVITTYFLVKRIFPFSAHKDWYGLGAMLILAISPWHIMLSRAAFEANVANFFIIFGVWAFLAAMQEKPWYLLLSASSFVLSLYVFNSARVVAPLLVITLSLVFWRKLFQMKKVTILAVLLGILLLLPIVRFLFSPQASLRFKEVNIFSDVSLVKESNQEIANDKNAWYSKSVHNRRLIYTTAFLHHYFDNLNPLFLFTRGDGNPKFATQDVGEMYLWDIPFFVLGIFLLVRNKEGKWWLLPVWLLLSIIPAATARETPHALRIESGLPTWQILISYGFIQAVLFFKKQRNAFLMITLALLALCVVYFQHGYYVHYPNEFSGEWEYGYIPSIAYVKDVASKYDSVYITEELGRPYIYYLFSLHTDPKVFRKDSVVKRDVFGFVDVEQFGKYHFVKEVHAIAGKVLYVDTPGFVPGNAKVVKTFQLLNGQTSLVAYTL